MKQLNEQQLQAHVPIIAWLLIATNLIVALVGMGMSALIAGAAALVRDPQAVMILPLAAVAIPTLMIALAIPGLTAGFGLLARKSWARVLGVIVSVFGLVNFPIGTLVGTYAIFVLLQDAAVGYLSTPKQCLEAAPGPA